MKARSPLWFIFFFLSLPLNALTCKAILYFDKLYENEYIGLEDAFFRFSPIADMQNVPEQIRERYFQLNQKLGQGTIELVNLETVFEVTDQSQLDEYQDENRFSVREVAQGRWEVVERELVIHILKAPNNNVLEPAFKRVFDKLQANGIPAVIMDGRSLGSVYILRKFHPDAKGVFIVNPNSLWRNSGTHWHEWQHIEDLLLNREIFLEKLGPLPDSIVKIIQKEQAKIELTAKEKAKIQRARRMVRTFLEVSAEESATKEILNAQGFREIVLTKSAIKQIIYYFAHMFGAGGENLKLMYDSIYIDPLNPRNIVLPIKATIQIAAGVYMNLKFTALLIYTAAGVIVIPYLIYRALQ